MIEEETWTTRDGQTLTIRKMGDRHLLNTIRYLERTIDRINYDSLDLEIMHAHSFLQGEMALASIPDFYEEDEYEEEYHQESRSSMKLANMRTEALRRGLTW